MSMVLRLAEDLRRFDPETGLVVLLRERAPPLTLVGAEWGALLDALGDGSDEAGLADRLAGRIAPARLSQMIGHLRSKQILLDGRQLAGPYGIRPALDVAVRVTGLGEVDLGPVRALLAGGGVRCDAGAAMDLVVTDDYLRPELAAINRDRIEDGRSWLLAMPGRSEARIGPLFVPGRGPCWRCLESRNRPRHQAARYLGGETLAAAIPSGTAASVAAATAMLVPILERFTVTGEPGPFGDQIRTIDFTGGGWRDHRLIRRPQCPDCGDPAAAMPRPIGELRDDGRTVSHDGGQREVEPLLTFEAMAHHLSPVTGIADALIEAHADEQILCYGVVRSDAAPVRSASDLVKSGASVGLGWGKGWTHAQARMSALGEAIERFTFSDERPPDHVRAALSDIGEAGIDPRSTLLFSDAQYERAGTGDGHDRIPEARFDPGQPIGWTIARSLTTGKQRLLASDQMWLTPLTTRDGGFCIADSNGCAAGNTIEEAILQGLLELIERDSVAIWWYNQLPVPEVDLASFGDDFTRLRSHYASAHDRDLWVLDLTMDLGIPVFAALSARRGTERPEYIGCFGCHLDPTIAMQRALTEMGMIMVGWKNYLAGAPAQQGATAPAGIERWLRETGPDDQPQLRPSRAERRGRGTFTELASGRCAIDIRQCVERLERAGVEVIVADATRPDIGLPVVRVIAPGLRHFRPRFGPGRLFDVPMSLGRGNRRRSEDALNPIPLPF